MAGVGAVHGYAEQQGEVPFEMLQTVFAELDNVGVNGPINFGVEQDAKNSELNALTMWQTGLGLPERGILFRDRLLNQKYP